MATLVLSNLPVGSTTANLVVTAQDGETTQTYVININRANIFDITPRSGSIKPGESITLTAALNSNGSSYSTSDFKYLWTCASGIFDTSVGITGLQCKWIAPYASGKNLGKARVNLIVRKAGDSLFPITFGVDITVSTGALGSSFSDKFG